MPQVQSRDEPEVEVVTDQEMTNLDSASDTEAAKLIKEKMEEIKMAEAKEMVIKNEEGTIFTKDNAIKVGGGVLAGVALKVAYDHLTDDGGSAAAEMAAAFDNLM